jgi:Domain of unknown function (DUF4166)
MTSARLSNLASSSELLLDDHRFRALLPDDDWGRLPLAVWRRFSKRLAGGKTVVYVGEIEESSHSRAGWWLAQLTRLIGGPLPTGSDTGVPIIVTVTEDAASGGQVWTRICARAKGFPQVIHSAKRFAGPTGLEEYIGFGISMALRLSVRHEALFFHSAGYFLSLGSQRLGLQSLGLQSLGTLRLPLPEWLTPGRLTVSHADLGGGTFRFSLELVHPRHGQLIRQSAIFREAAS